MIHCAASSCAAREKRRFRPGNDIGEFATERGNKEQARTYGYVMHATAQALETCATRWSRRSPASASRGGWSLRAVRLRICGASSRFGARSRTLAW